jgi:hypothetical protein
MINNLKIFGLVLSIITIFVLVAFISRPDRGGAMRCEKLSEISGVHVYLGAAKNIFPWKPFEEPKFIFNLVSGKQIMPFLRSNGYSNWKVGGIAFGSIDVGSESQEDNIYSSKNISGGRKVYISVSEARTEIVFVIRK